MIRQQPVESAAAYNAIAAREGWPSLCDHMLQFTNPALSDLLAVWQTAKASRNAPARSDMSPRLLKPFLTDIAIYERSYAQSGERRYRVRLFGTSFARVMGNLTGKFIDEAVPAEFLPRWHASLDLTLAMAKPLRFLSRSDTNNMSFLVGEYFSAPLTAEDGSLSMILAASCFDGTRQWRDVESEARATLALD